MQSPHVSLEEYNKLKVRCNDLEAEIVRLKKTPTREKELADALEIALRRNELFEKRKRRASHLQEEDKVKIVKLIKKEFGISEELLKSKMRDARISFARNIAIYLFYNRAGMTATTIARFLGRDHSTVISNLRTIERGIQDKDWHVLEAIKKITF